jgi:hypothetical protein
VRAGMIQHFFALPGSTQEVRSETVPVHCLTAFNMPGFVGQSQAVELKEFCKGRRQPSGASTATTSTRTWKSRSAAPITFVNLRQASISSVQSRRARVSGSLSCVPGICQMPPRTWPRGTPYLYLRRALSSAVL